MDTNPLQALNTELEVPTSVAQPLYLTSRADADELWRMFESASAYVAPDIYTVARGFVKRRLNINSDRLVVAHFASEQDRTAGKPDHVITLTEALIQNFPEHTRYSAWGAFTHALGILAGGNVISEQFQKIQGLNKNFSFGNLVKTIFSFNGLYLLPNYFYGAFFGKDNLVSTLIEETRKLDHAFGVFSLDQQDFTPSGARYVPSDLIKKLGTAETTFGELPFVKELKQAQEQFWSSQAKHWVPLSRYRFVQQARQAYAGGWLSGQQFQTIMLRGAPRIPLTGPFSLAQLKERTDAKGLFEVQNLAFRNVPTLNMVRFMLHDGSEVMYIPNSAIPFVVLRNETERRQWISDVLQNRDQLQIVLSHMIPQFPSHDESERYALEALEKLAAGETLPGETSVFSGRTIQGDLFESMRTSTEVFMKRKSDTIVATAWDGWRDALNRDSILLGPLGNVLTLGTGIEQAVNARTKEELISAGEQIATSIFFLAIDGVLAIKGGGTHPVTKQPGQAFFKAPSKINGQIGYPLSPTRPPRLPGALELSVNRFEVDHINTDFSGTIDTSLYHFDPSYDPALDNYFPGPSMDHFIPEHLRHPVTPERPLTERPGSSATASSSSGLDSVVDNWSFSHSPTAPRFSDRYLVMDTDLSQLENERQKIGEQRWDTPGYPGLNKMSQRLDLFSQDVQKWGTPSKPRPTPPEASLFAHNESSLIDSLLDRYDGIVLGENHTEYAAKNFIIEHLDQLYEKGVRRVYFEGGIRERDQVNLDRNYHNGNKLTIPVVNLLLDLDILQQLDPEHSYFALAHALQKKKMHIITIDTLTTVMLEPTSKERVSYFNHYAAHVINEDQATLNFASPDGKPVDKWIALVGKNHMTDLKPFAKGIAEQTASVSVEIADGQGPVIERKPTFSGSHLYPLKSDYVITRQ